MSQNLSAAAVVIGALRVKVCVMWIDCLVEKSVVPARPARFTRSLLIWIYTVFKYR